MKTCSGCGNVVKDLLYYEDDPEGICAECERIDIELAEQANLARRVSHEALAIPATGHLPESWGEAERNTFGSMVAHHRTIAAEQNYERRRVGSGVRWLERRGQAAST